PHGVYRSQGFDKWVAIAVTNEEEWSAFCKATGHPQWTKDERFADPVSRWHHQEELDRLVTQWTLERTDYEAMHILQKAGVPAGPILDAAGMVSDPHLNQRGFFIPLGEVEGRPYVHPAHPWRSSGVPQPFFKQIPPMGEDNYYVMGELLGMSEAEITRLVADRVLV
ncbi:MAG: carnitine dehydratase, partial [Dehalococcoidia bacterium]|nr:carnitine dehydratase [Dehalococcoidia bacterium]